MTVTPTRIGNDRKCLIGVLKCMFEKMVVYICILFHATSKILKMLQSFRYL